MRAFCIYYENPAEASHLTAQLVLPHARKPQGERGRSLSDHTHEEHLVSLVAISSRVVCEMGSSALYLIHEAHYSIEDFI